MSTKERYGTAVWQALVALDESDGYGWAYQTVGEVAVEAGVSSPTARKYLDELCEMGNATFFQTDSGRRLYRPMKAQEN